jgi:hypothetical protein
MAMMHDNPRLTQGDYVRRLDGSICRVAHIWDYEGNHYEFQPASGEGSVYVDKSGWGSFSGGLEHTESMNLNLTWDTHRGHGWTWTRGSGAGMGITFSGPFRIFNQTA